MSDMNQDQPQVVLSCTNLNKTFTQADKTLTVLDDINFSVQRGERVAIVGASGSGKSTLLHILGGLDTATSGQVMVANQDMQRLSDKARGQLRNKALGFVYQLHHLLPEFTAQENVAMPLLLRRTSPKEANRQAKAMLERVGLGQRLTHKPSQLSGGERQRAAIARALVTQPACVLADEPTGSLDNETADKVYQLFLEMNQELGTSLVIVTHDLELAKRADRIYELHAGQLRLA